MSRWIPIKLGRGGEWEEVKEDRWVRRVERIKWVWLMWVWVKKVGVRLEVPEWGEGFCFPGAAWRSSRGFFFRSRVLGGHEQIFLLTYQDTDSEPISSHDSVRNPIPRSSINISIPRKIRPIQHRRIRSAYMIIPNLIIIISG